MNDNKLTLMVIGAHPDDCEIRSGGLALKYKKQGHNVIYMSATNGETGHHEMSREQTARVRKKEFENSCNIAGIKCIVTDIPSNDIQPDIKTREKFISIIRECKPDVLITHRLNDYHPDHRITSQLVQDSSYAIKVPKVCNNIEPLRYTPIIMYMSDNFKRPYEFSPDIVINIDEEINKKMEMIASHKSQLFEWLPWVDGISGQVPEGKGKRFQWMKEKRQKNDKNIANRFRKMLCDRYGKEKGEKIKFAEAFELSEYGKRLKPKDMDLYFPK